MADCFDDVGAMLIFSRGDRSLGVFGTPTLTEFFDECRRGWSRQDIRAIGGIDRGYLLTREAVTDRDVVSDEEMETHPAYAQFLAKHNLKYFAGMYCSPDPQVIVGFSIQRRRDKPPYSETELEIVGRFGRYIEKSPRVSIRLLNAELANVGLGEALARLGMGVFARDSLKRVVFANPAGERLLSDGLALSNERLLAAPPDPVVVRYVPGLPPREAAQELGITEETARTALKRVFAKIGVSRQSELAALLTKLVLR